MIRPPHPNSFKMLFSWAQNLLVRFECPGTIPGTFWCFQFFTRVIAMTFWLCCLFCQQVAVWGRQNQTTVGECQLEHGWLVYWSRFSPNCCWPTGNSSPTQVPKLCINHVFFLLGCILIDSSLINQSIIFCFFVATHPQPHSKWGMVWSFIARLVVLVTSLRTPGSYSDWFNKCFNIFLFGSPMLCET